MDKENEGYFNVDDITDEVEEKETEKEEKAFTPSSISAPSVTNKKIEHSLILDKVKLAKKGDQAAFNEILCHMHNFLCKLTKEFFIQGSEAQDVYQEGAIKLMNVIEKFNEKKGTFISFAQASIKKHLITLINKEQAQKRLILNTSCSLDNSVQNEDGDSVSYMDIIIDENTPEKNLRNSPLDVVQKDYEEYVIGEICKELSDMEAKVFVLRFIRGLSYKEVAKELKYYHKDFSTGKEILDQKSIDNAIFRSRPKIKKVLDQIYEKPKKRKRKNAKNSEISVDSGSTRRRVIHHDEAHIDNSKDNGRGGRQRKHNIIPSSPPISARDSRGNICGRKAKRSASSSDNSPNGSGRNTGSHKAKVGRPRGNKTKVR